MKLWKNLTPRGEIFFVNTLFVTITFYLLFPVGRLEWYIATTDVPPHEPHVFKECPGIYKALSFGDNSFTIDKDSWFCRNNSIPEQTQIYCDNKVIKPTTETKHLVTFNVRFINLTDDWKLIAKKL